jgi:hypothetical protein
LAITYHAGRRVQGLAPADETYSNTTRTTGQTSYSSNGTTMTHYIGERFTATKWRNVELKTLVVYGSRYTTSSSGDFQLKVFGSDHVTQIGSTITGTPSVSSMPLNSAGVSNTTVTFDLTGITSPNTEFFIGVGTTSTGGAPSYVFYNNAAAGTDGSNMWEEYNGYTNFPSKSMSFTLTYVGGDAKPTDVQVGSRFEETDTRKMYHYEAVDPTYESDFTTNTGWVEADSTNTGVDTSTERLDFNIVRSTTNGKAYYDLGSALSDTAWVIRFKCVMTASANGAGSNTIGSFGMSSVTGDALTTQDFLGHYKAGNGDDVSVVVDGSNLGPGTGSSLGRPLAGTTRYHEMKRTSATSWTNSIYSTSDYSGTPDATHTLTIASSIIGLRYFNIANYNSGSGAGVLSGYIDDVKIYDGVTTASMPNAWSEEGT